MTFFVSLFSGVRWYKVLLLAASGFAVLFGIVLQNRGILPLDPATFFFFSFVLLMFALYRLGWTFLLFVAVLPLEIVSVAPASLGGLMIRPYQWLAVILLLAVGIRFLLKRLPFRLFDLHWFDVFPVLVAIGAFLSAVTAPDPGVSLKQAFVVTSFVMIYFLGRIFIRTLFDVRQSIPFFLLSSAIVAGYALWQNVVFLAGGTSFQVMAGRPNATFSEADWLGLFMILALGAGYAVFASLLNAYAHSGRSIARDILSVLLGLFLLIIMMVLIITVARSAWLGALAMTLVFGAGMFFGKEGLRGGISRPGILFGASVTFLFGVAAFLVVVLHLSPFQFLNRIQSTGSGLQMITVSCNQDVALPERIDSVDELLAFGCRHIDLEVIDTEKSAGFFVKEVFRPDPNVSVRRDIYQRVGEVLRERPLLGIGWGSISAILGTDERGAGLNASNMFLEVWLGSGLLGFAAFVSWWCVLVWVTYRWYRETEGPERLFALFLLSTLIGLSVGNLFNSGILLGFFFLFLSLYALGFERLKLFLITRNSSL